LALFWVGLGIVLLFGLDRILAGPDRSISGAGQVVISELGAAGGGPLDEDGDAPDWIELHNRGLTPVNLADWSLTDDLGQPDKWTFRDVTLAPGAYLIVFASGRNERRLDAEHPFLHTNFRLNADGGQLALYPPTSRHFIDATVYDYPAQLSGVSYGLIEVDGRDAMRYLAPATPGVANDAAASWTGVLPPVRFSLAHGYYDAAFDLELSSPTPGATIRYTTDGREPTLETGQLYTAALRIAQTQVIRVAAFLPGYRPSPTVTQSYLFIADVLAQGEAPAGWPATWGTHRIDIGPYRAGTPVEADYGMDPRIAADPAQQDRLITGLREIPTLSLVIDPANLDIYADPQTRGPEMERPVSVEWMETAVDGLSFQINAGLRIQGGAGRWEFMPKHSFRLFFRQDYGAAKLNERIFPASPLTEYNTLILRAGSDESFAGHPSLPDAPVDHRRTTYLRDEWMRQSQLALSKVGVHGRFVHLYLNGLYWGLYNVVERPDTAFAAAYFGGERDLWAAASHSGAVDGLLDRFNVLLELASAGGLDDPAKYATFLEFFDPVQFSDYVILNWYAGNSDWPENNWFVNVQNPAGRNRFILWDGESTWRDGAAIVLGSDGWEGAPYPNVVKAVFNAAWANPEFRIVFADRLYRALAENGALSDAASQARWRDLMAAIDPAILAESARWGDVRYPDAPITYADWQTANDAVLAQMEGNGAKLLELARAASYYPPLDPPAIDPPSAPFTDSLTVRLAAPRGTIYATLDGSDPRLPGGEPSPQALAVQDSLTLTTTTTLQARTLADGVWSALLIAPFAKAGETAQLAITEIMYNPYVDEEMEFLELANVGDVPLDLGGAYFEGIDFRFADGTTVRPGATVVLVRELKKFRRRYGEVPVQGVYSGKLSDKGETLTLYTRQGEVWLSVRYDDERGWPLSADGAGDSLVRVNLTGDPDAPHTWRASTALYGAPGVAEP
jgi:hypothetical protein